MKEVNKWLEWSCPQIPGLIESDVDSDGKDSLCEHPQFKSGGALRSRHVGRSSSEAFGP